MKQRPIVARRSPRPLLLAVALALALTSGLAPIRSAEPVAAGTAETMEAKFLSLFNADRVRLGLVPLRLHGGLVDLAGARVISFATKATIAHSAAGCLSCQLNSWGINWYGTGEATGGTSYPFGDPAVTSLYNAWKGSPHHWALLMSKTFNYVGIGVAYRSANKNTYASIVFTESNDQTPPWAQMVSKSSKGTTVSWTWKGADTSLQRRTAGLRNFDVQYRVDGGTWKTIATGTNYKSWSLSGRARGHWYGLRVRARDNLWYTSPWTAEMLVWVP